MGATEFPKPLDYDLSQFVKSTMNDGFDAVTISDPDITTTGLYNVTMYNRVDQSNKMPATSEWWMETVIANPLYAYQIARSNNGVYYRTLKNGTWSSWEEIASRQQAFNGTSVVVTNANDAPAGISVIASDGTNAPFNAWSTLMTVVGAASNYKQQFAYSHIVTETKIGFRVCENGTWGSWKYFVDEATLNSKIEPTSYIQPTVSHGDLLSGGYCKIGKIVIINMRINMTTSTSVVASNLPVPLNKLSNTVAGVVAVSTNAEMMSINGLGEIAAGSNVVTGVKIISGIYVCE